MLIADCATFKRERRKSIELTPKFLSGRVALLLAGGDGVRLLEFTSAIAGEPLPQPLLSL
jgi:hypothetical protein